MQYVSLFRTTERGPEELAVVLKGRSEVYLLTSFKPIEEKQAVIYAKDVDNLIKDIVQMKTNNLIHKIKLLEERLECPKQP